MVTIREAFEARLEEFQHGYEWEETDQAVRALTITGELLDLMFPGDEAAIAMMAMRRIIAHGTRGEWKWSGLEVRELDRNWRDTWQEIDGWGESSTPPFLDGLHDLNAFANFGIIPLWNLAGCEDLDQPEGSHLAERLAMAGEVPAYVESICQAVDRLEHLLPQGAAIESILRTRDQARARLALDQGQAISLQGLALLSGVSTKRIQNAIYAKTDEAPVVGKDGLISPDACQTWLNTRDFRHSIWAQVQALYPLGTDWGRDVEFEQSEAETTADYVFVPVANDGSLFAPSLRREGKGHEGGFTIGAKGSERAVPDFDEALQQLHKMDAPRWRRPNSESGNWGVVTGQSWKRIRWSDLEAL